MLAGTLTPLRDFCDFTNIAYVAGVKSLSLKPQFFTLHICIVLSVNAISGELDSNI